MPKETVQVHEVLVDPQVQQLLNEANVTVNDYVLLHHGSLLIDAESACSELTEPFFDEREFLDDEPQDRPSPKEMRELFTDAREEFFNQHLEPIVEAKKYSVTRIDEVDLDRLEINEEDIEDMLSDLKKLGVDRKRMSVWQCVTAYKAGGEMLDELTNPARLGVILASGAAVTRNDAEWNDWETVALYSLGQELYGRLETEDASLYSELGVKTVTKNMAEYVHGIMVKDPSVMAIHQRILSDRSHAGETVKHYVRLLNAQGSERYQPDPETAHQKIITTLKEERVSWDDLMFSLGRSVLPKYHPSTFKYDWFADLAVGRIREIAGKKRKRASIDFSSVARHFRCNPKDLILSEWEQEVLAYVFPTRDSHMIRERRNFARLGVVERAASVPWLILDHCYEKSLVYFCYSLAVSYADDRYEKAIEQTKRDPNAFQKIYRELKRQNLADMPRYINEAQKMMNEPEIAPIFAEVTSGLSLEVTRGRIEWAIQEQERVMHGDLEDAGRMLRRALGEK